MTATYTSAGLDPGKSKVYGAFSIGGKSIDKLISFDPDKQRDFVNVEHIALEKVNINENTPNWQSTLDCGLSGERVAGRMRGNIITYTPAQWKGSIKKPQHHLHGWRVMSPEERKLFPPPTYNTILLACEYLARYGVVKGYSFDTHNFLDAACLLLFEMGRIGRGGQRVKT